MDSVQSFLGSQKIKEKKRGEEKKARPTKGVMWNKDHERNGDMYGRGREQTKMGSRRR